MSPQGLLPQNVITLINEFSKPLTRPDWMTLNPLPFQALYTEIIQKRMNHRVLLKLYNTIHKPHSIAAILYYTKYYGIYIASIILDMPEITLYNIELYFQPFIDEDEDFIIKYRY
jgi:hypothetical protein